MWTTSTQHTLHALARTPELHRQTHLLDLERNTLALREQRSLDTLDRPHGATGISGAGGGGNNSAGGGRSHLALVTMLRALVTALRHSRLRALVVRARAS